MPKPFIGENEGESDFKTASSIGGKAFDESCETWRPDSPCFLLDEADLDDSMVSALYLTGIKS
ncbi:hypothetical protein N7478_006076 [Penicillium angulare]|uniref:uncharacterized protein n=1 Tax=Penicillium angulare TaxID=116970 RepID=UPI0025414B8B|nr:uncharacterized protein N7478_006076 [Penicillium angulare]KAJ5280704.1 hypothetical protein N7478_006076 [Penicillium angulare]